MAGKRVLIVFAHEEQTSFNYAMLETAVETLKQNGWQVTVSDLYAMKFNPVTLRADVKGCPKNPNHFKYALEVGYALKEDRLCNDIVEEQKKLEAADLVIFQFPLYWSAMPAILKGWIDRIFTEHFAFTFETMFKGLRLKNKKALLSITTGATGLSYGPSGVRGDMNVVLWPIHNGILNYCGLQVLEPQITYAVARMSQEERAQILEDWKARLGNIWQEKTISFVPVSDFDMSTGGTLKKDKERANASEKYGLSVGQHLGKALPVDSQVKVGSSTH